MSYKTFFNIHFLFTLLLVSPVRAELSIAGEYIVKFKSTNEINSFSEVKSLGADVTIKSTFEGSDMLLLKIGSEAALQELYSNNDLEFIEPNYVLHLTPISASLSENSAYSGALAVADNIQLRESWGIEKAADEKTKTIVAVIDTGLDREHPLFQNSNSVWENLAEVNGAAGVDDDRNGYVDDFYGWNFCSNRPDNTDDYNHGTHVAGIVLGVGQDIFAVPLEESKVKIMALKFIDASGVGSAAGAVNAIYYAVRNGAKVINNSWGGATYSRALHEAYAYAYRRGVVIVSAAGNLGSNNDLVSFYPANFETPNNIAVLATDYNDQKALYSNYGSSRVSVGAPGDEIVSANANGGFQAMTGTSMAAPFVAGLAAMIHREANQLTAYQIKNIIMETVDFIPALGDQVKSSGRINALKAVAFAKTQTDVLPVAPRYSVVPDVVKASELIPENVSCGLVKNGGKTEKTKIAFLTTLLILPVLVGWILKEMPTHKSCLQKIKLMFPDIVSYFEIGIAADLLHTKYL